MPTILLLLPSESPIAHKVENNQLVTQAGTYSFHKIVACDSEMDIFDLEYDPGSLIFIVYDCKFELSKISSAAVLERVLRDSDRDGVSPSHVEVFQTSYSGYVKLDSELDYILEKEPELIDEREHDELNRLSKPLANDIRVTQVDGKPRIIEIDITQYTDCSANINSINYVLDAVLSGSDYVPFRENALTKLLWKSVYCKRLTSILCMDTSENQNQNHEQILLVFDKLLRINALDSGNNRVKYAHSSIIATPMGATTILNAVKPKDELNMRKSQLKASIMELHSLRSEELLKLQMESDRKRREYETKIACALHSLRRSKNDELSSLRKEVSKLETKLSILEYNNNCNNNPSESVPDLDHSLAQEGTWFYDELQRKQGLLDQLSQQETELRESIRMANKLDVSEPYLGIIRLAEFNLKSLKRRLQEKNLS